MQLSCCSDSETGTSRDTSPAPRLGRRHRCHSCHCHQQKHLKLCGFGFPLLFYRRLQVGFYTSVVSFHPSLWESYPATTVCSFRQKTKASCCEIKPEAGLLHISHYWKFIWLNTYLNYFVLFWIIKLSNVSSKYIISTYKDFCFDMQLTSSLKN